MAMSLNRLVYVAENLSKPFVTMDCMCATSKLIKKNILFVLNVHELQKPLQVQWMGAQQRRITYCGFTDVEAMNKKKEEMPTNKMDKLFKWTSFMWKIYSVIKVETATTGIWFY